jgi:hypothetical protein
MQVRHLKGGIATVNKGCDLPGRDDRAQNLYLARWFAMFLGFLIVVAWVGARFPTNKYFPLQAEYTEVDVKEPIVQACYEYGKN